MGEPEGWEKTSLASVLRERPRNGYSPQCPNQPNGRWILSLGAVSERGFVASAIKPAPPEDEKVANFRLSPGELLISRSNTRDRVGYAGVYSGIPEWCAYPDLLVRLRVNAERVHVGYLEAFVLSSVGREYFQTSARGTSGSMVKINRDIIERFEILLPPLAEQRKIAAILSSVDEAIEKTLAVIDKVQVVKKGLMQELLTKGLPGRHKTFKQTEIGRIPGEWSTAELSDIGNGQDPVLRTGPFGSSLKTEHFRPSGVPVLTIQSLGEGEISDEGLFFVNDAKAKELRDYRVRQGDLVFSRVADIGRSVVIPERADGWIISSNLMRISPDRSRIDSRFLMYLLVGSPRVVRQIEQLSGGEGRKVISSPVLKKLLFPMPAIDEQVTIADTLGSLEGRIREERRHREGLLSLKSALQSLLLTGEIRVRPTPAPEPAP